MSEQLNDGIASFSSRLIKMVVDIPLFLNCVKDQKLFLQLQMVFWKQHTRTNDAASKHSQLQLHVFHILISLCMGSVRDLSLQAYYFCFQFWLGILLQEWHCSIEESKCVFTCRSSCLFPIIRCICIFFLSSRTVMCKGYPFSRFLYFFFNR